MDKHVLPNRPPTTSPRQAFGETTGLRLAPPGLLQVSRWRHLTEDPAVVNTDPAQPSTREDR